MKGQVTLKISLTFLFAAGLLSGCLTNNRVGVRHDGTLAVALNEEGHYEYLLNTDWPRLFHCDTIHFTHLLLRHRRNLNT